MTGYEFKETESCLKMTSGGAALEQHYAEWGRITHFSLLFGRSQFCSCMLVSSAKLPFNQTLVQPPLLLSCVIHSI